MVGRTYLWNVWRASLATCSEAMKEEDWRTAGGGEDGRIEEWQQNRWFGKPPDLLQKLNMYQPGSKQHEAQLLPFPPDNCVTMALWPPAGREDLRSLLTPGQRDALPVSQTWGTELFSAACLNLVLRTNATVQRSVCRCPHRSAEEVHHYCRDVWASVVVSLRYTTTISLNLVAPYLVPPLVDGRMIRPVISCSSFWVCSAESCENGVKQSVNGVSVKMFLWTKRQWEVPLISQRNKHEKSDKRQHWPVPSLLRRLADHWPGTSDQQEDSWGQIEHQGSVGPWGSSPPWTAAKQAVGVCCCWSFIRVESVSTGRV